MNRSGWKTPVTRRTRAFTLIELLVVITVIGVLAALLLPVLGSVTKKSHETVTLSNMRQFGMAALLYANDNNNRLPNRAVAQGGQTVNKWPTLFHQYIPDLRAYTSPIPAFNGKSYAVTNPTLLLSNDINYTSYIINGYNDLGAFTDSTIYPQLSSIPQPSQTILFGIPYPLANNYYMDFVEGGGNNNDVLNRGAFGATSVWVFTDGSSRVLNYNSKENMKAAPVSSGDYTDWLWLINKADASIIQ